MKEGGTTLLSCVWRGGGEDCDDCISLSWPWQLAQHLHSDVVVVYEGVASDDGL